MACSQPPAGRARWRLLLAEEVFKRKLVPRVGREAIRGLLETHDHKLWRENKVVRGELDEAYIAKTVAVLRIYEKPLSEQATKVMSTRSLLEFADFRLGIAEHYPAAETIYLVMDNLSTHTRKAVVDRFGEEVGGWLWNRFTVHYSPKHGSWLNQP